MELIIKATETCNFACTFCSASNVQIKKTRRVPDQIVRLLKILQPDSVIITGGDPLCVDRQYYEHLLSLGDWPISMTSNLKAYYLNREYWKPILSNDRIGVTTSFQYGSERLWDKNTIYDETMFRKVMSACKEDFDCIPSFIAVITPQNYHRAIDHVYLAKELGTKVKLNGVTPTGRSKSSMPLYKMIDIWDKVYQLGLQDYVQWAPQFTTGGCNWNTTHHCQSCIRAAWVDHDNQLHYSFCETLLEGVLGNPPVEIAVDSSRPKPIRIYPEFNDLINKECLQCDLSDLCNGCTVNRMMAKCDPDFCEQMKKRRQTILSHCDWKIHV